MATELTSEDKALSLEELHRMSLVEIEDGVFAQRVVVVDGGSDCCDDGPVIVSGAGTTAVNGTYTIVGTFGGFPLRQSIDGGYCYKYGTFWVLSTETTELYYGMADTDSPCQVPADAWERVYGGGVFPLPTVCGGLNEPMP